MSGPGYSRIILGLEPGPAGQETLRFAAAFAGALKLDLVGLFAQDPGVTRLAGFAQLREYLPLQRRWRTLSGGELARDLELASARVRRSFESEAAAVAVRCRFEVAHGPTHEAVSMACGPEDIVLVRASTPASARADAAALFVPETLVRRSGPVLALARSADDPVIAVAASVARALGEAVEVAVGPGPPAHTSERLIVTARRSGEEAALAQLALSRRVPVLAAPLPRN